MRLYCVYDKVAEMASTPYSAVNDGIALRMFERTMIEQRVNKLEDFELYFVSQSRSISAAIWMFANDLYLITLFHYSPPLFDFRC